MMNSLSLRSALPLLLGALVLPVVASAAPMDIKDADNGSRIQFTAHTKIFDATGQFRDFDIKGKFDPEDFTQSKFSILIKTKSIDTDNGTRDDHLKSDDFFHVEKHPEASFEVDKITKGKKADSYDIQGTLTIKGKKTKHTIPVSVTTGPINKKGDKVGTTVTAKFKLNRMKVGIDWPGSLLLPDIDETVDMDVKLVLPH